MREAPRPLDFAILGPLEVRTNGRAVRLHGPRQAALLAVLLLRRNEVVSIDRLMKDLWDGNAPRTARDALHVHISHLRKSLGPVGHVLATRPNGYVLAVEPEALDADRFTGSVEQARRALARNDARGASSELRRALALWRGPALADFSDRPFAQAEIRRLEELRLEAIEDRIQADLALGKHAALVAEIEAHVAEHPLRERPRRQLMLALYRSGRQAEALDVYRDARETLVRELGIEPSRDLRTLQQAVLRQDRRLDLRPPRRRRREKPVRSRSLIGREDDLREVTLLLRTESTRLLTLTGPGGVGKTRLAVELGTELADDFQDGVFLVDLAALSEPDLVGATIARSLSLHEAGQRSAVASLKRHLAGKRVLLILDNFEQVLPARELVRDLLTALPRLTILATSRRALDLPEEGRYPVDPLTVPPADKTTEELERYATEELERYAGVALFLERARAAVPSFELSEANAAAIASICRRLDGLPLALELAAARLRLLSPDAIAARLGEPLALLTRGARESPARHETLRAAIEWSHRLLSPSEQLLFARLAVFPGGWSVAHAEALNSDHRGDLLNDLDALLASNLVYEKERAADEPRFAMLQTIREYAQEKLEERGDADEVERRRSEYFAALTAEAEPALTGGEQQAAWLARLDADYANLRASLQACRRSGADLLELRLASSLRRFWLLSGRAAEGRGWLEDALSKTANVQTELRAKALLGASSLARMQGDYSGARSHGKEAHALYSKLGDTGCAGRALSNLAGIATCVGDGRQARILFEQGIELLRQADDAWGLAVALTNLGELELGGGQSHSAHELFDESLALYRRFGDEHGVEIAVSSLAVARLRSGDVDGALPLLEEAIGLAARLGDKEGIARCLEDFAVALVARGEYERGARILGGAEAVRSEIGSSRTPVERQMYEETVSTLRRALDEETLARYWEDGQALESAELISTARP